MSTDQLRDLFTELADEVTDAQLVAPAIRRAGHIRRRRRVMVAAGLAVVVTLAGGSLWLTNRPGPPNHVASSGQPTSTARATAARVDLLPQSLPIDQAQGFWPASTAPPTNAPSLLDAPLSHAVLLVAPFDVNHPDAPTVVYAYGEGNLNHGSGSGEFHWVRIPVDLVDTRDASGNQAIAVDVNSLGPGGAMAAFAQPDAVVVVDLVTFAVHRIPLPGLNEYVTWLANGTHVLVGSATQTWLVNVNTRKVTGVVARASEVTPLVGGGSGLSTISMPGDQPPAITFYDDPGRIQNGHAVVNSDTLPDHHVSSIFGRGWRYGSNIAQAASGTVGRGPGDFIMVLGDHTGNISNVLDLGGARNKGCCTVLGWMSAHSVLIRIDPEGLLEWDLTTGAVTRHSGPSSGVVSIAPYGCDFSVTVDSTTSSCTT